MTKPLVVVIAGPTASGKTGLSVEIAKELNGEIVSADSMQIYKSMDIATAKPTKEETAEIKHHLIDFVNPEESFSVAKYKDLAYSAIDDILSRKTLPIVVGGTGLYIDALINNTVFLDYPKNSIRDELEKRKELKGMGCLYDELKRIDPKTAEKLHINDSKRIIRALELYYTTGKTISEQNEQSHNEDSPYDFLLFVLNAHDRQVLYDRINLRVDKMLEAGLIDEAKAFFASESSKTAKQAIGYKELKPYLDGEITLSEAVEKLKMETRRYAKRQLTWFRNTDNVNWLYIDEKSDKTLVQRCIDLIREYSGG
ncbi:MAG: tRNA (adenosine(37)-N6)-dimethylallyltransferase MiaA [Acutalibacteraceae bacterium]